MSASQGEEGSGIAPQNKGSWSSFLKSIASFNGDLASLTAPPFILGTISLTEFSAYWTEHPSIFVAPANEPDPEKRALLVLKWFLTTLKQQYASRSDKLGSEKKPLNPFLGELYTGKWDDENGTTNLISEQVSHHPPVTAYSIWNDKHGIRLQGYNGQKASFSRTIHIKQIGHALLHIDAYDEDYIFTLPSIHIEGLIYGNPFVELNKSTYISSSSGFVARIDYSGKGWVSGKKNAFSAVLYRAGHEKDPLYTAEGQWSDNFVIKEGSGGKKAREVISFQHKDVKTSPLQVPPLEQQDELEANRAWGKVKEGILKGDMDLVGAEKTKIETSQRELRKKEAAEGREWSRRYFSRLAGNTDPLFDRLAKPIGGIPIEPEKTGGIWRFDVKKAESVPKEGMKTEALSLWRTQTGQAAMQNQMQAQAQAGSRGR
ncbi:Oxysterol binding protein [Agyrium rufum]|nr:Oxysterol binding protein [Agyrium rufum]